jgi:hypothetical protein
MRKQLILIFALTLPVVGQTKGDSPLPAPVSVFDITDSNVEGSPVKCLGTANAYVKPQPKDQVMTWVEETNLSFKNVSEDSIVETILVLHWKDVRGNLSKSVWRITTSDSPILPNGVRAVGKGKHQSGYRPTTTQADFDASPVVVPSVDCRAVAVVFADGYVWTVD